MPSWSKIARRVRVPLGFLFAAAYIWLAHPTILSIVVGISIAFAGLCIRALASGHVEKNEVLATSGPYAHTRNPLYLGSIVLAIGFLIAARSWWLPLIAAAMLLVIYVPVIRSEETFLRTRFPEFEDYAAQVPRLFPRIRSYQRGRGSFSWHLYWKHREYNALLGAGLMIIVLVAKSLWLRK
ncbi:MAG TPA: isoprenylcysteine carboxylmethyltransferase family protein [Candidatus Acidoferrum sp.]|nr:isoprenylcysteine carboxylmethyltransferase family protein [Candidatus Acidoferrum sp.]